MINKGLEKIKVYFSSLQSTQQLTSLDDERMVTTLMQNEDEINRVSKSQITDLSETVYIEKSVTMNMWLVYIETAETSLSKNLYISFRKKKH